MSSALSGIKIAVLGGDDRELILVSELVSLGATVTAAGFPREKVKHGAFIGRTVEEALRGSEVAILPMPGTDDSGYIRAVYTEERLQLSEKSLRLMAENALMIIGTAKPSVRSWAEKCGITLLEIGEMDEVAIMNSIPTAEGAIQIAMEEMDTTIHGCRAVILGMGRIGTTLARDLHALGAQVGVVSREPGELARAYEMGCHRMEMKNLSLALREADVVFNTIPAPVLGAEILRLMNSDTIVIDLATQPGGTDFEAANRYGVKAILAPGLPGKVAPRMAGRVLAELIPGMIVEQLARAGNKFLLA